MNELVISYIRTGVPVLVGHVAGYLTSRGINLDPATQLALIEALGGLFTALYYFVVRLLEKYVSPQFGWLLGYAKMPVYTVKAKLPNDL